MAIRVGVFAMIQDERGRVLLCHRRDCDFWNQPGGGLELGEAPWGASCARRARSAAWRWRLCGWRASLAGVSGGRLWRASLAGVHSWARKHDETIVSFVCRTVGGILGTSDEADGVAFFEPDALPPNTLPEHADRIRDALRSSPDTLLVIPTGPTAEEVRLDRA